MSSAIMPTYFSQAPIAFERGQGPWVWDTAGKQYLDSLCGIAVTSLGHAHPAITQAITEQAAKLIHTSNTYRITQQEALAEVLTEVAGMEQAFFCNSGAEATETAIKLARAYGHRKGIEVPTIIVMEKAFHGRTMGSLSASNERIRTGFEPLLPGFIYAPFNNLAAIEELAKHQQNIVGVMLEPIQGEGGIHVPHPDYLKGLRALCDKQDWLLIVDEVQTGMGRTGKWFAYQHSGIAPDVVTVAKALANGVPIGACMVRGKACNPFAPGKHGSTFGGNPLACAAALATINTIRDQNLVEHIATIGEYLRKTLAETLNAQQAVIDVRGQGLMLGVELDRPCRELMLTGLKHGLLFNITSDKVIRLLPPFIITQTEADEIVKRLNKAITEFVAVAA
jgi:acetylornithine aminotransferase